MFHSEFVKTGIIDKNFGKLYSDLFDWRQESDYADFRSFDQATVIPLLDFTESLIREIQKLLQ